MQDLHCINKAINNKFGPCNVAKHAATHCAPDCVTREHLMQICSSTNNAIATSSRLLCACCFARGYCTETGVETCDLFSNDTVLQTTIFNLLYFMWMCQFLASCGSELAINLLSQTNLVKHIHIYKVSQSCVCVICWICSVFPLSLSLWAIFQTILYTINSGKKSKTNKSEHQANNMPIRQMFLCIPTPIQLMKQLASSEMMWYVLSGDNISPTYNARSLIERAYCNRFCHTISAGLGVQQRLHFVDQSSKMLNVFSAYVLFFSLLALLVDAADSLKNGWRHRKCASTHQVDLGPSCIMIYTHIHALQSGLNCRLCRRRLPSRNKTMLWICTCTFGLLCLLS